MNINKLLTPYNYNSSNISRIKFIVIHYVGATGDAKDNCKYYASQKLKASAHYFVGFNGDVWQSVEDKNIAWSVGGKKYHNTKGGQYYGICTNANSLNIEMCVRKNGTSWYFEDATVQSTIELTKELMKKYNIDVNHVIRHYDVVGKECPYPYVYDNTKHTWFDFKKAIVTFDGKKSGWIKESDGWRYYLGNTGNYIKNDWHLDDNGRWSWFDGAGIAIHDTWKENKGLWYYFAGDCYMISSQWLNYKGNQYYLTADGSMATNAYIQSKDPNNSNLYYWVNSEGIWEPQWNTENPDLTKYIVVV